MKRSVNLVVCTIAALTLMMAVGCGGGSRGPRGPKALKMTPPPPKPPAVPAAQAQPLDRQLLTSARQEIRVAFESNEPVLRANALEAAQQTIGAEARDLVLRGLRDDDPLVRFAAAMSAGQLRLKEAYRPLLRLVNDRNTRVRIGVRYALHRLGDTRFSHDLEKTAQDPDRYVRGQTAMVLGLLGEPSAVKILRQMLHDDESLVRLQAAEAMWRLGDEDGLKHLATASVSRFADDQLVSIQALAAPKDKRVVEHIRGKLVSDWDEVALAAARAMGQLGYDEGYGVAMKGVKSTDPRQRALAALAFGAIGRSDAQPYLAPMLRDPDASVRLSAATGLLQLSDSPVTRAQ
jgi:HEAT repeat protein